MPSLILERIIKKIIRTSLIDSLNEGIQYDLDPKALVTQHLAKAAKSNQRLQQVHQYS